MRQRKKHFHYMVLFLVGLVGVIFFFFFVDPDSSFNLSIFELSAVYFFFLMIFLFVFGLLSFFLKNTVRGVLGGAFVVSLLALRYFGFYDVLYILILLGIVVMLELYLRE